MKSRSEVSQELVRIRDAILSAKGAFAVDTSVDRLEHVARYYFGPQSAEVSSIARVRSELRGKYPGYKASRWAALAHAIAESLNTGWLDDPAARVRMQTHSSLLELATSLLEGDDNEKMAACMVAGAVLENHLRNLCQKYGKEVKVRGGKHPTIANYNTALYDKGGDSVYGNGQRGLIEGWGNMRNAASHHDVDAFEPSQAQGMIDGVSAFIENYPA